MAEAFAQQAYTAVGNRDRAIMRDPYLLGFEIVDKNEENTRITGVFAFRVAGEIIMVPVFYLNGQCKGQDLMYRKGVNRFGPNTEKWVAYLMAKGEDEDGRGVNRRNLGDARMNLNLRALNEFPGSDKYAAEDNGGAIRDMIRTEFLNYPALMKQAAEGKKEECCPACAKGEPCTCDEPCEKKAGFIRVLWKQAMDDFKFTDPGLIFGDLIVSAGMQKQAAQLVARFPEMGDWLELAGSLEPQKQGGVLSDLSELAGSTVGRALATPERVVRSLSSGAGEIKNSLGKGYVDGWNAGAGPEAMAAKIQQAAAEKAKEVAEAAAAAKAQAEAAASAATPQESGLSTGAMAALALGIPAAALGVSSLVNRNKKKQEEVDKMASALNATLAQVFGDKQ